MSRGCGNNRSRGCGNNRSRGCQEGVSYLDLVLTVVIVVVVACTGVHSGPHPPLPPLVVARREGCCVVPSFVPSPFGRTCLSRGGEERG